MKSSHPRGRTRGVWGMEFGEGSVKRSKVKVGETG